MMKKSNKKIIMLITSMVILLTSNIIYANNEKDISIDSTFTKEDGIWYPGRVDSKDFYITNNNESNINISKLNLKLESAKDLKLNQIIDINSVKFKELSSNSIVKLKYKENVIFEDNLNNLLSEKGVFLKEDIYIESKEKALLNLTIDMDENMNNDAQLLENIFNIGVVYQIDDNDLIKPMPPTEKPNKNPNTSLNQGIEGDSSSDKLPQTGGILNSASLICIGTIVIGTGLILNKKSSQEKGGKHHE